MRRAWAAQTIFAVLFMFVGGPLLHLHPANQPSHHSTVHEHDAVVHTHFPDAEPGENSPEHPAGELTGTTHCEEPVNLRAIALHRAPALDRAALSAAPMLAAPPSVAPEPLVFSFAPRVHDPPLAAKATPRAPPV